MSLFGEAIGYDLELWDFWAIYGRTQQWHNGHLPEPEFWQHQMVGLPTDKKLNVHEFNLVLEKHVKNY